MNTQERQQQEKSFPSSDPSNYDNLDFEQWAKAVRTQLIAALQKRAEK